MFIHELMEELIPWLALSVSHFLPKSHTHLMGSCKVGFSASNKVVVKVIPCSEKANSVGAFPFSLVFFFPPFFLFLLLTVVFGWCIEAISGYGQIYTLAMLGREGRTP